MSQEEAIGRRLTRPKYVCLNERPKGEIAADTEPEATGLQDQGGGQHASSLGELRVSLVNESDAPRRKITKLQMPRKKP